LVDRALVVDAAGPFGDTLDRRCRQNAPDPHGRPPAFDGEAGI
jgi:hypothetical protein